MNVPVFDLTRQYESIKTEIDEAVGKTLRKGRYILGNNVEKFEHVFSKFHDCPYGVGVGSGTDAITLALRALRVTKNDEVIVPANAYPSVFAVHQTPARIVLCDVLEDGTIDLKDVEKRVTERTKVIMPVHLYGMPCRMDELVSFAQEKDINIVEDCAQAHGASIQKGKGVKGKRQKVGSFGDIGIFSFYPTKNLGAYGDGGLITTSSLRIRKRVERLRMYGEVSRYQSVEPSGVSRLDELQAAILLVKLKHLVSWTKRRREIVTYYKREFADTQGITFMDIDDSHYTRRSVYHLFVVRVRKRTRLQQYLEEKGIGTAIHYPVPIHRTKAFVYLTLPRGTYPVSEKLCKEVLSFPLFPELTDNEVEYVAKHVKKFYR